jgi:hypothetical protein
MTLFKAQWQRFNDENGNFSNRKADANGTQMTLKMFMFEITKPILQNIEAHIVQCYR